jgi:hypothetical protein
MRCGGLPAPVWSQRPVPRLLQTKKQQATQAVHAAGDPRPAAKHFSVLALEAKVQECAGIMHVYRVQGCRVLCPCTQKVIQHVVLAVKQARSIHA